MSPRPVSSSTSSSTSSATAQNSTSPKQQQQQQQQQTGQLRPFIRGVNLGGWLILERYITPYQFALTDCHIRGDFCWYPGQASAPPTDSLEYKLCDPARCKPFLLPATGDYTLHIPPDSSSSGGNNSNVTTPAGDDDAAAVVSHLDYPLDEYTLASAFGPDRIGTAQDWLNYHFENFITRQDLVDIRQSGLSHVRVPLPHWILGNVRRPEEPWIVGNRWMHFKRLCQWCRELGLQVWPDIHTAPGSQNGFDNSGHALSAVTCKNWLLNPEHVARSLDAIRDITAQIFKDGLDDVVTGFGLLNEPFKDCDQDLYTAFLEKGLDLVRHHLGPSTAVYVSDMFLSKNFNDGSFFLDPERYHNTYLDSHYYQVFERHTRELSPRQHIAYVCQNQYRDATDCCYQDAGLHHKKRIPSQGIQRLAGEWSAATDELPVALLQQIMQSIAVNGTAARLDRKLSQERQDFLRHFVQAQMVAFEAAEVGMGAGWFFWTAKMEGGSYAEWDYLRGVREGWMPVLPPNATTPSQDLYGTCYDIIFRTSDDMSILHEFPDAAHLPENDWAGPPIDDDVVLSHGDILLNVNGHYIEPQHHGGRQVQNWMLGIIGVFFLYVVSRIFYKRQRKKDYAPIDSVDDSVHHMTMSA